MPIRLLPTAVFWEVKLTSQTPDTLHCKPPWKPVDMKVARTPQLELGARAGGFRYLELSAVMQSHHGLMDRGYRKCDRAQ